MSLGCFFSVCCFVCCFPLLLVRQLGAVSLSCFFSIYCVWISYIISIIDLYIQGLFCIIFELQPFSIYLTFDPKKDPTIYSTPLLALDLPPPLLPLNTPTPTPPLSQPRLNKWELSKMRKCAKNDMTWFQKLKTSKKTFFYLEAKLKVF